MNMYMNYGRDGLADCCVVLSFDEIKTLLLLVVVVVVLVLLLLHMSLKHTEMPVPIMPQKPSDNLWLDKNRNTKTIGCSQIHVEAWQKNNETRTSQQFLVGQKRRHQ